MLEDGTSLAPAYGGIGVTPLGKWCLRFRRNLAAALRIDAGRPCGLDRPLNRADRSRGVAARRPYDDARGAEYFREVAVADRGKQAPAAVRKAWVDIISARQKAVTLVVGFIKRLSGTVRASSAYPNAFAAMRHLASIDGNDTSICTAGSYNKYVRPALGGEFGSDARNTVVLFLAAFEEEMKNGGARALCGENYSADELRAERARVRAATYPSEILTATSSSAAFAWLNGQCGGGHLPTSGPHYDWIMRRLDWVRDALGDGDY